MTNHTLSAHLSHARADVQRVGHSSGVITTAPPPQSPPTQPPVTHSTAPDTYYRHEPSNQLAQSGALSYTSFPTQKPLAPAYQISPTALQPYQNVHPEMYEQRAPPAPIPQQVANNNGWPQIYMQHQPPPDLSMQHPQYPTRPFYVANA